MQIDKTKGYMQFYLQERLFCVRYSLSCGGMNIILLYKPLSKLSNLFDIETDIQSSTSFVFFF
jgi:hypothetical protein